LWQGGLQGIDELRTRRGSSGLGASSEGNVLAGRILRRSDVSSPGPDPGALAVAASGASASSSSSGTSMSYAIDGSSRNTLAHGTPW
jgi:hypothetical protein